MKNPAATPAFDIKESQHYVKEAIEKDYINRALLRNKGNVLKSAEELGLARPTLHRKMKKHGIKSADFRE
jgi:transcriptional regulator of acetoin/glycerol metabolism